MIRVLRLGSSQDNIGETPPGQWGADIAAQILSAATGETVETAIRSGMPAPELPGKIRRYLDESQADLFIYSISSFWVEYETTHDILKRWGWFGRRIKGLSDRTEEVPWAKRNRLYRLVRRLALDLVGGKPAYTPAEVLPTIEAVLRAAVANEGLTVVVAGSPFSAGVSTGRRSRNRAARRREELNAGISAICARLHIPAELPPWGPGAFSLDYRDPDAFHFNAKAHRIIGELHGAAMTRAWIAAHPPEQAANSATGVRSDRPTLAEAPGPAER